MLLLRRQEFHQRQTKLNQREQNLRTKISLSLPDDAKTVTKFKDIVKGLKNGLVLLRLRCSSTIVKKIGVSNVCWRLFRSQNGFGLKNLRSLFLFEHKFKTKDFAKFTKVLDQLKNLKLLSMTMSATYKYPENLFPLTLLAFKRRKQNERFIFIFQDLCSKFIKTNQLDKVYFIASKVASEVKQQFTSFSTFEDKGFRKYLKFFFQSSEIVNRRKEKVTFVLGKEINSDESLLHYCSKYCGSKVTETPCKLL